MVQQAKNGNKSAKSQDMDEFKILFPETRELQIGTKVYVVSRFNLRQQKVFMDSIATIVSVFQERPEILDDLGNHLPELLNMCFDQLVNICASAVNETAAYVETNFDLLGLTQVIVAVFELNDIQEVIKNLQSLWRMTGLTLPTLPTENEPA